MPARRGDCCDGNSTSGGRESFPNGHPSERSKPQFPQRRAGTDSTPTAAGWPTFVIQTLHKCNRLAFPSAFISVTQRKHWTDHTRPSAFSWHRCPSSFSSPAARLPFFGRHPWLFAGAVARVHGNPHPGNEVVVRSANDEFIARGLFNPHSNIRASLCLGRRRAARRCVLVETSGDGDRRPPAILRRIHDRLRLPCDQQRGRWPLRPLGRSLRRMAAGAVHEPRSLRTPRGNPVRIKRAVAAARHLVADGKGDSQSRGTGSPRRSRRGGRAAAADVSGRARRAVRRGRGGRPEDGLLSGSARKPSRRGSFHFAAVRRHARPSGSPGRFTC